MQIMPISVRDNSWAIGAGAQRAQNAVDNFNSGLTNAAKGFERGMIIGRIKEEEDDYIKAQKLQNAIANNDTTAIQELMQDPWYQKAWNAITGKGWTSQIDRDVDALDERNRNVLGQFHSQKMEGYAPAETNTVIDNRNARITRMPDSIGTPEDSESKWDDDGEIKIPVRESKQIMNHPEFGSIERRGGAFGVIKRMPDSISNIKEPELEDRNKFLRSKAQAEANRLTPEVPTTVARAAETAGIDTGYMKPSERDKIELEHSKTLELLGLKNEHDLKKWMAEKGLQGMDLTTAALYRSAFEGDSVDDNTKAVFAEKFGFNKNLQSAVNGLEQFSSRDSAGNLTKEAQSAITTAGQSLANRLNAEARKATDSAQRSGLAGLADRVRGAASNVASLGTGALQVFAAAIEDAFGANKEIRQMEVNKLIAESSRAYDSNKIRDFLAKGNPMAINELGYSNAPAQAPAPAPQSTEFEVWQNKLKELSDEQLDKLIEMGLL